MKREIKFRAWDGEKMNAVRSIWFGETEGINDICVPKGDSVDTLFRDFTLMQFTGLKDKNGKEIYEGDVVGSEYSGNYQVYWNKLTAAFWLKPVTSEDVIYIAMYKSKDFEDRITLEIIGNIYENPEFLNEKVKLNEILPEVFPNK